MNEDPGCEPTSDRIVHICVNDGDDVDRVIDSWIEVGDVVVVDDNNAGRNAERKQICDSIVGVAVR